jgi:hypothetical protein
MPRISTLPCCGVVDVEAEQVVRRIAADRACVAERPRSKSGRSRRRRSRGVVEGKLAGRRPGRGRRFVWQIGLTIRFLDERLAHQIPRASCNGAIGPILALRSPGIGRMVLIPLRPESCRRPPAFRTTSPSPLGFHSRRKPPEPWRNATLRVPGGSDLTALLTGSPRVRQKGCLTGSRSLLPSRCLLGART